MVNMQIMSDAVDKLNVALNAIDDPLSLTCILGTAVDQWASNKDVPDYMVTEMWENLCATSMAVHQTEGRMPKCAF